MKGSRIVAKDLGQPTTSGFSRVVACDPNKCISLALELGVDFAEVQAAMDVVYEAAIQQAVADGLITQAQADWLLSHRGGQAGQQGGSANGAGSRGGHGAGGNGGNGGICPNVTP